MPQKTIYFDDAMDSYIMTMSKKYQLSYGATVKALIRKAKRSVSIQEYEQVQQVCDMYREDLHLLQNKLNELTGK